MPHDDHITTELLPGGVKLLQSGRHLKLGADAILLAAFCPSAANICELGCGVGNVLLALAGRHPRASLVGVEINPDAAALCRESIALGALGGRVRVIIGDLREPGALGVPPRSFDLVAMNPPYLRAGTVRESPDPAANLERIDRTAPPEAVARAAAALLRPGGSFCAVLKADRIDDYLAAARAEGLAPCELLHIAHSPAHAHSLALLRAEKGGAEALRVLPALYLTDPDGSPSDEYARILAGGTILA